MKQPHSQRQVVVTARGLEQILGKQEAVSSIEEAANEDAATSLEDGVAMAAMGKILNEVRRAEQDPTAVVLSSPQHGPASRFQSLIASGAHGELKLEPLPAGGYEAKFDARDWLGWATVAWAKLKHPKPHDMIRPTRMIAEPLAERARIALLGDWGTGLYGAPKIGEAILGDPDPFAVVLHLGDVYYSGEKDEVRDRFLDVWPMRAEAKSRAVNSNHEMYAGGEAYFRNTLPHFGQEASYFAFQNKHWTLVGLDVAYRDHDIDDQQVEWLKGILAQVGTRKVVLFSHHQLFSHFESQGSKLWSHAGFGEILRSKRIFAWYWGHEHRCALFEAADPRFGLWGRCIGHGGMPQTRKKTRELPRAGEKVYERADWRRSPAKSLDGNLLPSLVVLEGRNDLIVGEEEKFTPHGYAVLVLDGANLTEQVLDPLGRVIYESILGG